MRVNFRHWGVKLRKNILGLSADVWVSWIAFYFLVAVISQRDSQSFRELSMGLVALSIALSIYCILLHTSLVDEKKKRHRNPYIERAVKFFDSGLILVISHMLFEAGTIMAGTWKYIPVIMAFMLVLGVGLIFFIDNIVELVAQTHELRHEEE
ncbi:MAG: hypothetical protein ABH950_00430 [Candidatus Altiarchaeota archaeon]